MRRGRKHEIACHSSRLQNLAGWSGEVGEAEAHVEALMRLVLQKECVVFVCLSRRFGNLSIRRLPQVASIWRLTWQASIDIYVPSSIRRLRNRLA